MNASDIVYTSATHESHHTAWESPKSTATARFLERKKKPATASAPKKDETSVTPNGDDAKALATTR